MSNESFPLNHVELCGSESHLMSAAKQNSSNTRWFTSIQSSGGGNVFRTHCGAALRVTYVCTEPTGGPAASGSVPLHTHTRRSRRPRQRCEQDTANTPAAGTTSCRCLEDTLQKNPKQNRTQRDFTNFYLHFYLNFFFYTRILWLVLSHCSDLFAYLKSGCFFSDIKVNQSDSFQASF